MNHCEACYDLGAECECDCHSKTPSTTSKPVEEEIKRVLWAYHDDYGNTLSEWKDYPASEDLILAPELVSAIQSLIDKQVLEGRKVDGNTSDGYHTFNELYEFRMLYNAHLFNEWGRHKTYPVMKSKKHSDGQPCFDGTYFIVVALLPTGQISNHYKLKYWDIFDITEYEQVPWEFDNHTPKDVAKRLLNALQTNNKEKK